MITLGTYLTGAAFGAAALVAPQLIKSFQIRELRRLCARTATLVLSYDDGPGPILSRKVLERLTANDAKGTFFLLGLRARQHPETVELLTAAGHEVACHSQAHRHAWKCWPMTANADISGGYATLQKWMPPNAPFRPPYGKLTLPTLWSLRKRGAPVAWWTADSGDTHDSLPRPECVVEHIQRDRGGVVLLHDFDRSGAAANERAEFVLRTTDLLLQLAVQEGLAIRTFSELLRMSHARD